MNINAIVDPLAHLMGAWSAQINIASVLLRIALSFLLAAIVGCERANKLHSAGLPDVYPRLSRLYSRHADGCLFDPDDRDSVHLDFCRRGGGYRDYQQLFYSV